MRIEIELPIPPSLNNAYANVAGRGRVPSKTHREWKEVAGWTVKAARLPQVKEPYHFTIWLPDTLRGDPSNYIKLAEDLMVSLMVIPDDRHALSARAAKSQRIPPKRCRIEITTQESEQ